MQIKRYETATMQEAKLQIKKELGPHAIILSMKKISDHPPLIEILAARDEKTECLSPSNNHLPQEEDRQGNSLSCLTKEIHELKSSVEGLRQKILFQDDLSDLKEMMNVLMDNISVRYPDHLRDIYTRMIATGISRSKAAGLVEAIKNNYPCKDTDTYEKCTIIAEELISRSLMKDDRKESRVKAFIGPTGVGKTTTLAKLAAHYSIEKKMKVGMITTDTYRIAAADQLKVYAKIMGLPIQIASKRDIFLRSLASFSDKEIILVDTPGHNHNDDRHLNELKDTLGSDVETILLLSPVVNREYLINTSNRFKIFKYDRLILTKVDECNHLGSIYNVLDEIGKPVSHVTTGQNVPRDIETASPERLAKLILDNRLNSFQLRG
jgi:flagellar biosynthesis protein FlhF